MHRGRLIDYRQEPADGTASHAPTAGRALPLHWRHLASGSTAITIRSHLRASITLLHKLHGLRTSTSNRYIVLECFCADQSAAVCEQRDLAAVILSAAPVWHRHGGEQEFTTANASHHQHPRLDKGEAVGRQLGSLYVFASVGACDLAFTPQQILGH